MKLREIDRSRKDCRCVRVEDSETRHLPQGRITIASDDPYLYKQMHFQSERGWLSFEIATIPSDDSVGWFLHYAGFGEGKPTKVYDCSQCTHRLVCLIDPYCAAAFEQVQDE